MNVHIFFFFFWQCYKLFISTEGHSRYQFPWSPTRILPFTYGSSYHNYHHSKNDGNFSASVYIFELVLGMNKSFFDGELAKAKAAVKSE
jgi:sterol desaturase/sphingolipid hydroxylase (fatty acid hydroxylase superfamily)